MTDAYCVQYSIPDWGQCYSLQMIISFKLRTEESSGNEYFNEINSVAAVVKFGSTDVQELGHGV